MALGVCIVIYCFSTVREPVIYFEEKANDYIAASLFYNDLERETFRKKIASIANKHSTSIYIVHLDRPLPSQTFSQALEAKRQSIEEKFGDLKPQFQSDALVVILTEKPRSFVFSGIGHARTKILIRNISSKRDLRSLQLRHAEAADGRHLLSALDGITDDLSKLNFFVENHPASGMVYGAVRLMMGSWAGASQNNIALNAILSLKPHIVENRYGITPLYFFIGILVAFTVSIEIVSRLITRIQSRTFKSKVLEFLAQITLRGFVFIPLFGIFSLLNYGDLEEVASLAQTSGVELKNLVDFSRQVNTTSIALPFPIVILASYVVIVGMFCAISQIVGDFGVEGVIGASTLIFGTIEEAGCLPALILVLVLVFGLISLPMAAFACLFSIEGSMGSLLLVVLTIQAAWRISDAFLGGGTT